MYQCTALVKCVSDWVSDTDIVYVGLIVAVISPVVPLFAYFVVAFITCIWLLFVLAWFRLPSDEPGGAEKASEEKRKDQTTPVVSPSQGSPEEKEERWWEKSLCLCLCFIIICLDLVLAANNFFNNPCSSSSSNSSSKSESSEVGPNTLNTSFPRAPSTSDSIRLKCREMLASALQTGGKLKPLLIFWSVCFLMFMFSYFQLHFLMCLFIFYFFTDDHIAIGADCEELGAQIEEYILKTQCCWSSRLCDFKLSQLLYIIMLFSSVFILVLVKWCIFPNICHC